MTLSTAMIVQLAMQCAPNVAPLTVAAIVAAESRGEPYALNVNGGPRLGRMASVTHAVAAARRFVNAGYSVDLGLGQINSRNMRWLGLTWDTVFDPCANIAALGAVLSSNYTSAKAGRDPQAALRVALSLYNTGSPTRGFSNGYVAKVVGHAGVADTIPALATAASPTDDLREQATAESATLEAPAAPPRRLPPPKWNVFERAAYERENFFLTETERGRE